MTTEQTDRSIDQWIEDQDWSATKKDAARTVHALRTEAGLSPLTLGAWLAWANNVR